MHRVSKSIANKFVSVQGFSLVEALVVVLISSFIIAGIYVTTSAGENMWEHNKVKIELQQETRKAMENMLNDLRMAGDSSITNVPANGTTYNTITFKTPSGVTSGSLTWNLTSIQYVLSGTQLQRIDAGVPQIIGQNFQTIQFRRQVSTADTLEVVLQASKNTVKGIPISYQLDFNIQLRN